MAMSTPELYSWIDSFCVYFNPCAGSAPPRAPGFVILGVRKLHHYPQLRGLRRHCWFGLEISEPRSISVGGCEQVRKIYFRFSMPRVIRVETCMTLNGPMIKFSSCERDQRDTTSYPWAIEELTQDCTQSMPGTNTSGGPGPAEDPEGLCYSKQVQCPTWKCIIALIKIFCKTWFHCLK